MYMFWWRIKNRKVAHAADPIAKKLRAKIVEIESSKSNDKKEFINRDEAIKRIKEAKDLFDTGILSQGEYDELVTKYKAIIMGN